MSKSDQEKIELSKEKYDIELQKLKLQEMEWKRKKRLLDKRKALRKSKLEYLPRFKVNTTKLVMAYIIINCTIVEIYSMWVMVKLQDISGLYTLITSVIGETIAFLVYAVKSTKENTQGGIIYEKMKLENTPPPSKENNNSDGVG